MPPVVRGRCLHRAIGCDRPRSRVHRRARATRAHQPRADCRRDASELCARPSPQAPPPSPTSPPSASTTRRATLQGLTLRGRGLGSGVVIDRAGYVVTNYHVIRDADEIRVQLADGRVAVPKLVGTDPDTELALLKIDLPDLPEIRLGRSDTLEVGDVVLAIGNSLGLSQTVTMGIVSATGRGARHRAVRGLHSDGCRDQRRQLGRRAHQRARRARRHQHGRHQHGRRPDDAGRARLRDSRQSRPRRHAAARRPRPRDPRLLGRRRADGLAGQPSEARSASTTARPCSSPASAAPRQRPACAPATS